MITFPCPKCNASFTVEDSMAGKAAKCSQCANEMIVPAAGAVAPVQAPPLQTAPQQGAPAYAPAPAYGAQPAPGTNAPGAVAALVCGLVGLVCAGVILGIIAIVQANKAKAAIRANPALGGSGMATAGLILGVVDIVLGVIGGIIWAANMSNM